MSADSSIWFSYADENLAVARLALESGYYNACLQNVQQAVEKYLKASLLFLETDFPKTHSIAALNQLLQSLGVDTNLSDEDCDLLDTIYLPSKYPAGSVLADFSPDRETGVQCVQMAERVRAALQSHI